MNKRTWSIFLVLLMTIGVVLSGCSAAKEKADETANETKNEAANEAANETESETGDKKEIAVLIGDMTATYASWLAQSFEKIAEQYPDYNVTIIDNKNDVGTQISNLENATSKNYDMVVIQPIDSEALIDPINATIAAGIPVCTVNGTNEGSEEASCVDADPIQQGSIPAEVAFEKIPEGGKVVVLLGPSGNIHSLGRREGFKKTLFEARPDIEILDEQIANWYKDEGMRLMEDWLQKYDQIDAIISMNDAMALGAIEAAKSLGRDGEMTSYGVDGLADACLSVKDGDLTATCVQNAYAQAEASLDICDRVLKGEIEKETILVDGELIDSSNVDEWIQIHTENGQIK